MRAIEWEKRKDRSLLLRGKDLREAEEGLVSAGQKDPQPTDLQRQYVLESRRRESQARNTVLTIGGVVLVMLAVLSIFSLTQRNLANNNAVTAVANRHVAETAQADAVHQKETAIANEEEAIRQSRLALARQLAAQSQSSDLENGTTAIQAGLLAVEAGKRGAGWAAEQALRRYLSLAGQPIVTLTAGGTIISVDFSSDGRYILSGDSEGNARIWDAATGEQIGHMHVPSSWPTFKFSSDDRYVLIITASYGSSFSYQRICVFRVPTGSVVACIDLADETEFISVSLNGRYMISGTKKGIAQSWNLLRGREVAHSTADGEILGGAINPKGTHAIFYGCRRYDASKNCTESFIHSQQMDAKQEIYERRYAGLISDLEFSPDGNWIIFNTCDSWDDTQDNCVQRTIHRWELETDKVLALATTPGQGGSSQIYISPDARYVALIESLAIQIWELRTGIARGQVSIEGGQMSFKGFSPDGYYFSWSNLIGRNSETLYISDVFSGRSIASLPHPDRINLAAFSSDGKHLVTGGQDGITRVWQTNSGREIARLNQDGAVYSGAFSPFGEGKYVVSAGADGVVRLWQASRGDQVIFDIVKGSFGDSSVSLSPDSKFIVAGEDRIIRVWEVKTRKEFMRITADYNVESVIFSPDQKYLIAALSNETVIVWDVETRKVISSMTEDASPGHAERIAVSADSRYVASSGSEKTLVWESSSGTVVARIADGGILIAFTPDGKYLALAGGNSSIRIWEVSTGRAVTEITHSDSVTSLAFSPDGRYIMSGSNDSTARLWETTTGMEVTRLIHDSGVTSVAFSPDGKFITSASRDKTARIWETTTGREVARLTHDAEVSTIAFSPTGRYVVSGSSDQTIRVWETLTAQEIVRIPNANINADVQAYPPRTTKVTFSPDGRFLVPSMTDETINLWYWKMDDLVAEACKRSTRNLAPLEWHIFLPDEEYRDSCEISQMDTEYLEDLRMADIKREISAGRLQEAIELIDESKHQELTLELFGIEEALLTKFMGFISSHQWEEASDWLQKSEANDLQFLQAAYYLNELCWSESLDGNVLQVFSYCERAVMLNPTDPMIRDSRGLARALKGDFEGAIEDFQFFVDFFIDDSSLGPEKYNELLGQRRQWIMDLKAGKNPFTPQLLEMLKQQ